MFICDSCAFVKLTREALDYTWPRSVGKCEIGHPEGKEWICNSRNGKSTTCYDVPSSSKWAWRQEDLTNES